MSTFVFLLSLMVVDFVIAAGIGIYGAFAEKDLDTLASIVALPGVFLFFGLLMTVFC
jgi:hypothetical protein